MIFFFRNCFGEIICRSSEEVRRNESGNKKWEMKESKDGSFR